MNIFNSNSSKSCLLISKGFFVIIGLLLVDWVGAQSLSGVTNIRDTSYSTPIAYEKTKKDFPNIKIVLELNSKTVKEKREVNFCKIGKRRLKLNIFSPVIKSKEPRTAVLIIHGGGWRSGSPSQHYPLAQKLAQLGYVCYVPEYRLSTEALFPAAIYDVKSAIRWVRKNAVKHNVASNKIVVLGFSAGGEMAAFMGTTGNMPLFEGANCTTDVTSDVNAVVDIDGTLSFVHPDGGEGDDSKGTSAATYWFGYSKIENPKLWETASPLSFVSAQTPPTLFINSAISRMHAGREDYIKVLNEHNIYSEVHTFEGAPHSFCLFEPWFDPTVKFIDSFLNKTFDN
ncbi:alpha/beta hydrolase [Flavobacterium cellulosilyticum]|uniref:Alpha/beta hydrolase n=1 Tax=Flavobacterium cellulosilyticum TaxID=2541731 RepID=A0A4R5CF51_9FLAO|nr:alpha/beta hydrolase [Flavobacterium cellulosilyticum]TDD98701.1 alpha/beta hydrolase [Flavobacterium cellulosilyticum]